MQRRRGFVFVRDRFVPLFFAPRASRAEGCTGRRAGSPRTGWPRTACRPARGLSLRGLGAQDRPRGVAAGCLTLFLSGRGQLAAMDRSELPSKSKYVGSLPKKVGVCTDVRVCRCSAAPHTTCQAARTRATPPLQQLCAPPVTSQTAQPRLCASRPVRCVHAPGLTPRLRMQARKTSSVSSSSGRAMSERCISCGSRTPPTILP